MQYHYLIFFIVAFLFALLINSLFLKFSQNLGVRQNDDIIRWTATRKPSLGGITFFIVFLFSITIFSVFFDRERTLLKPTFIGIFTATIVGFLIGLADDAYDTKPFLKFSGQFLCGIILCFTDLKIELFEIDILNYALTVFWVVGLMNSINMLDNMDSITTLISISMLGISALLLYRVSSTNDVYVFLVIGVLASLISFLLFNWNPAKMYMGDTGSRFLGVFLAAIGIKLFWNSHELIGPLHPMQKTLAAVLIFILPMVDTTTVFINRIMRGQSPFVGGKDHTTHCLVRFGFSERQVAILYFILAFFCGFLVFPVLFFFPEWSWKLTLVFALFPLLVFVVLYATTKRPENKNV